MKLEQQSFEALKATGSLPSPKGAALTIMKLCQDDDISVARLSKAIKADPAFVGRLIKAANTVGRCISHPVASVEDALQVLGISTVRALALGFSLVTNYRQGRCSVFDYDSFWYRSLITGLALEALSRELKCCSPDEAFCLGLLSHVGRLALATVYGERYSPILEGIRVGEDAKLCELERQVFALDHEELTAAMLLDWGFQEKYVEPLYFSRKMRGSSVLKDTRQHSVLVHSLLMADTIAMATLASGADHSWRVKRVFDLGRQLELPDEVIQGLLESIVRNYQEWGEMLAVHVVYPVRFLPLAQVQEGGHVQLAIIDPVERQRLRPILLQQNYEVLEQTPEGLNSEMLLLSILEVTPDILVTDVRLEEGPHNWLRSLRETRLGRAIFVVLMVPAEDERWAASALEEGADVVLDKGASERSITARLMAARRMIRLQQEIRQDWEEVSGFATDLAVANRRLHEIARTDVLTCFYNRRYAMELLQHEWDASRRGDYSLACMMIDLDNFKQINDCYGHDVGDRLLVRVAEVVRHSLRGSDVPCRVGGDEFLVICPNTNLDGLRKCAERLLEAVRRITLETSTNEVVGISLSIGLAMRQPEMDSPNNLLRAADERMYLAKLAGRDGIGGEDT